MASTDFICMHSVITNEEQTFTNLIATNQLSYRSYICYSSNKQFLMEFLEEAQIPESNSYNRASANASDLYREVLGAVLDEDTNCPD
jgi:hypothetical protein